MWTRSELKEKAKATFKLNYWPAVVVGLVLSLLVGGSGGSASGGGANGQSKPEQIKDAVSSIDATTAAVITTIIITVLSILIIGMIISIAFTVFLKNPLSIGCYRFFVLGSQSQPDVKVSEIGYSFKEKRYGNVTVVMFLRSLFTGLWSLLFVIPGVIKAYEYRMIPYLLAENPQMDHKIAFVLSKKMMDGEKWNAFVLDLSFFGWALLSACTCGVLLIFYVSPYIQYTDAYLYQALRSKITPEEMTFSI